MKRRQFGSELKKKIAIEAIREQRTINEIANEHQVHPAQIRKWKKELLDGATSIFEDPRRRDSDLKRQEQQESVLQQKVGQLIIENDWLKKKPRSLTTSEKRALIESDHPRISISRQCSLVDLPRSCYYYEPCQVNKEDLFLMRLMDEQYTNHPSSGSRTMKGILLNNGFDIGRNRIRRLMQVMGLVAVYPKPRTTLISQGHKKYPYLLRNIIIDRPNQVWCMDITYLRMKNTYMYLTAVMDWYSRCVLGWRLSNTMDCSFCLEAVEEALNYGKPDIFNTDQGVQFTCAEFTSTLENLGIKISMDGKGRWVDNVLIERLWRSVKYELIYLKEYENGSHLFKELDEYFEYYNQRRPHQSFDFRTPSQMYQPLLRCVS
ncbi:MAG: IS3 family transposase [Parachlamydia sp.]|nr:IS3 family transposase [Parachlamydia sp.]